MEEHDPAALARALDVHPNHLVVGRMENLLREAHSHLDAFLRDDVETLSGAAEFATTHLVCRSVADLRAGTLLVGSGFVVQGFSVTRPILESMHLIDLFQKEPKRADDWLEPSRHAEFSASRVRRDLGIDEDEPYWIMCERSHPRFSAAQLSGWVTPGDEGVLTTGGLPLEHPQVRLAMVVLGVLTPRVAYAAGRVSVRKDVAPRWPSIMREVAAILLPGIEATICGLYPNAEGSRAEGAPGDVLESVKSALKESEKLERAAAQQSGDP